MLGNCKLFVDAFCEVRDFVTAWTDAEFCDFGQAEIEPGSVYLISRQQFELHINLIKQLAQDRTILPILGNPAEGSETMRLQMQRMGIVELVQAGKIVVVAGGYMAPDIPVLYYENFLPKILDYAENLQAIEQYQQQYSTTRPYKFLFLNGRARLHRRYLLDRLQPILDQAIWTNLDNTHGHAIRLLDPQYEFDFYKQNTQANYNGFAKYELFNNDWGEIYLNAAPYLDTHFSLVTETVFNYPYSFRTEKIWKPIAIGHPFIAVANSGYYQDLHDLGFRTFDHLIDESFDCIDDNVKRLERIADEVEWLCQQDLAKFTQVSYNICKYNQQLLAELGPQIRASFPNQFEQYINERS